MNTLQLTSILTSNPFTQNSFYGVLACDQLPKGKIKKNPALIIVNTHPQNYPGEHWLGLYLKDGSGEFFDSYGYPPDFSYFPKTTMEFLFKNSTQTVFNNQQLQGPKTATCGHHCVFFLYHRSKGLAYREILQLFCENVDKNDYMVYNFIQKI